MKLLDVHTLEEGATGYGRFTLKLVNREKEDWEEPDIEDYRDDDDGEIDDWGYAEAPRGKQRDKRTYIILDRGKKVGDLTVEWHDTFSSRPYETEGTFMGKPLPKSVGDFNSHYGNQSGQAAFIAWLKHPKFGQRWLEKNGINLFQ